MKDISQRVAVEDSYEALLKEVEPRSWGKVDTLSGEQVDAVTIKNHTTAVVVYSCALTNKPHIRTVILERDAAEAKWRLRTENTVTLPTEPPSDHVHICTSNNTRETVKSVTPGVTLSGNQVDQLRKLRAAVANTAFNPLTCVNDIFAVLEDSGV